MTDSSLHSMAGSPSMEDPDRLACRLIQRAWNRDGLPEIAVGISLLICAVLYEARRHFQAGSPAFKVLSLTICTAMLLACFALQRAVKWVRTRFLIARTGYVETKPLRGKRRALIVSIAMITGAFTSVVVTLAARNHFSLPNQWIVAVLGVLVGIFHAVVGRSLRFVFSGALFAVAGILLGIFRAGFEFGFMALWGVVGTVCTISGAIVLASYLRQTRQDGE